MRKHLEEGNMYINFAKSVMLPVSDLFTNWNVYQSFKFLMKSQFYSIDQLEDFKLKHLKDILWHAYNNTEYYKASFDKAGVHPTDLRYTEDLHKFPTITKDDIIEHFQTRKMFASTLDTSKSIFSQSSGSTGKRTRYFISPHAYGFNLAANIRGWHWMGYRFGDKFIKISQNRRSSQLKKIQDLLNNTYLFTLQYNSQNMEKLIKILKDYKPKYLRSYPDPLLFLSSYIVKGNIDIANLSKNRLNAINTTGNVLFPEVRKLAEETLKARIFDSYSCEGCPVVFECELHENYHVAEEYGVLEVLNEKNKEALPNEIGRIIVTDFHNYSFPFIRYESMDLAIKGDECRCGRVHKTIKSIIGRENDILITPSGQFLIGQTFTTFFKKLPKIDNFQVYQKSQSEICFKVVVNDELSDEEIHHIYNYWRKYTNNEFEISIQIVDSIPLLDSGKRRFLIRDKSISLELR